MALTQNRFRIRTDAGAVDAAATWGAAENVNFWPGLETNVRVRFTVSNTATTAAGPYILRLSKNAGAYAAVTTSTTNGIQSANASSSADEAAIATANFRLTAGAGTATAGVYDETGSATKSLAASQYTEFEYGIIIKTANVAAGDTLDLRIYNSTTAFGTYTQTPRFTVPTNRALLANDVASPTSAGQPAVQQLHGLLANDIASPSSVSQPAVTEIGGAISVLANDVVSASSVSSPAVHQTHGLLANDIASASSVGQPAAIIGRNALANDIASASSVTIPALGQGYGLAANDVASASSVGQPALAEIALGVDAFLAEDIVSASSVSTPTLVVEGEVIPVPPELPAGGGGGGVFGKAWQRQFDQRRAREEGLTLREYLKQVEAATLPRKKDQKAVEKASRTVREALGRAEAIETVDYGPRLIEALGGAAKAAGEARNQALARQMQLAEQAAIEFLRRLSEAAIRQARDEDEGMSMLLLDITGSAKTELLLDVGPPANDDDVAFLLLMSA